MAAQSVQNRKLVELIKTLKAGRQA
jgi:hypothetical protein